MPDIKPIETYYNGYRFRSRLEARWAVFFDYMGIKYEYEPEGFQVTTDCGRVYRYLPDFYFPKSGFYGEVKGNLSMLRRDKEKIAQCIWHRNTPIADGLILLGQIPYWDWVWDIRNDIVPIFPMLSWRDRLIVSGHAFFGHDTIFKEAPYWEEFSDTPEIPEKLWEYPEEIYKLGFRCMIDVDGIDFDMEQQNRIILSYELLKAFTQARQARFEHGETPRIEGR